MVRIKNGFYVFTLLLMSCAHSHRNADDTAEIKSYVHVESFPKAVEKCIGKNLELEKTIVILGDGGFCEDEIILLAYKQDSLWHIGSGLWSIHNMSGPVVQVDCQMDSLRNLNLPMVDSLYSMIYRMSERDRETRRNEERTLPTTRIYLGNKEWAYDFTFKFDSMHKSKASANFNIVLRDIIELFNLAADCHGYPGQRVCGYVVELEKSLADKPTTRLGCLP